MKSLPLSNPLDSESDVWSEWLLHLRHADDPEYDRIVRSVVERHADRVLDAAKLAPGMALADIGTGEGLLAFRAIDRIGPTLCVLLSDISAPLLAYAKTQAIQRNVQEQCCFLECPADQLNGIQDASMDVVTTRAVLAYVPDKSAALREFHRVLKPGGSISIAEPIFRDEAFKACVLRKHLDATPPQSQKRFLTLLHRWKSAQFPDTEEKIASNPISNFSERDLLRFVHDSGFSEIHLELHIDVMPSIVTSWEVFIGTSPHPWAPPLRVILAEQFTADERSFFEETVRPSVESSQSVSTDCIAYLTARKPLA